MENKEEKEKGINISPNEYDTYFKKYIKDNRILSYNSENILNKNAIKNLICPICHHL